MALGRRERRTVNPRRSSRWTATRFRLSSQTQTTSPGSSHRQIRSPRARRGEKRDLGGDEIRLDHLASSEAENPGEFIDTKGRSMKQIRALLPERGVAVRQGQQFLRAELPRILATPPDVLSPRMVRLIEELASDWRRLDERVESLLDEIEAVARQDADCERLMSVPGIGPIISSAMVAKSGRGEVFAKGRDFGAWLGTRSQADIDRRPHHPRQDIQARQSLPAGSVRAGGLGRADQDEELGAPRAQALDRSRQEAAARSVLAIALANKLARIAWSVLAYGRNFEARKIDVPPSNLFDRHSAPPITGAAQNEEPAMT